MRLHPNVQAVQGALESAGAMVAGAMDGAGQTCRVRLLPGTVGTAAAAARSRGLSSPSPTPTGPGRLSTPADVA